MGDSNNYRVQRIGAEFAVTDWEACSCRQHTNTRLKHTMHADIE